MDIFVMDDQMNFRHKNLNAIQINFEREREREK